MRHPDEGTIHAWLDGALSPAEARAFEDHVAGCAECEAAVAAARGLLAASSRILSALDNVPAGVIPGTPAEPTARSSRYATAPGRFRAARWRAAAALVVVAGTSWLVLHPRARSASDVSVYETNAVSVMADSMATTPPPQVATAIPQSTRPAAPPELSSARVPAPMARRAMAEPPKKSAAAEADSFGGRTVLGSIAGARSRIEQTPAPSANAYESRRPAAMPRVAVEAAPPARDAAVGAVVTTDMMERRAQSLAKADVAAKREEAQSADKDRAAIDSVLAADSARSALSQGYATLGAGSGGSAMKMRGNTSAPSAAAPSPALPSLRDESSIIDRAAGCYVIETTGWIPEDTRDRATPSLLPARIELQRAIGLSGDERGNRLARPAPGEPGLSPGVIGFWKPLGGDRIRITFADDTSWVALTLSVAPESVRGPARTYSASSGRLRSTEVEARRTTCR